MRLEGENKKRILLPRYQQVAVEIAERIADKRYQVGEKIHARSTLASNFNVSPETARKAINVLVDLGIMEVRHGSGAYVLSREKAQAYFEKYQDVQSIQEINQEIQASVEKQKQELDTVSKLLNQLLVQTKRVHNVAPFVPYELTVTEKAAHLERTVNELNIWHETGATIVAIQQKDQLLLSPGPYAKICAGDTLFFVGNELVLQRMQHLFYPGV
ncbi:GntR family transcriptional regulator [Enterococcus pseudoavium]|uniref:GntR family transcriptional regulator n=1 Tax=Enterococcus pseudoavium TaxID=44007 RepID=A0AAE4I1L5_9ENTE|nr:GntR family transcriptional regulator [Enterococcus pseudoavium]MDT2736139.1 GntR family transcriptional regulator [Enterococcus pseudoavium]MDT2754076.1 GntR family transcriptional regulator [Enterococcus pseudoavium]MDT2770142.1 GntR family transcriptional regulator [Enterococcus pseudoavium]